MSAFQVDDGRSFVGDLYWAKLPSHPVPLHSVSRPVERVLWDFIV